MKKFNSNKSYDDKTLQKLHQVHIEILNDFHQVCEKHNLSYFLIFGSAIGAIRHKGFIPWDDDTDVGMLRADYEKFVKIVDQEMGDKYKFLTPEIDDRYACFVPHLQLKGTKFVSQITKNQKYDQCIDLDIFPYDNVASDKKERKRQQLQCAFWAKLLFLRGTPYPDIPLKGIKGEGAALVCWLIHHTLKVFRISARTLFEKYNKCATRYNTCETKYVTIFGRMNALKNKFPQKGMFPLKEVPFENTTTYVVGNYHKMLSNVFGDYMCLPPMEQRVNHCPYMMQFKGEEPIYFN